ncbi:MAG: hypothetical protein CMM71_06870 [Rhodospirillaceae bacterium]|nr:hypothetical protein [Rhodospirillaceae bacterium]
MTATRISKLRGIASFFHRIIGTVTAASITNATINLGLMSLRQTLSKPMSACRKIHAASNHGEMVPKPPDYGKNSIETVLK